jgi:hypothetical protein
MLRIGPWSNRRAYSVLFRLMPDPCASLLWLEYALLNGKVAIYVGNRVKTKTLNLALVVVRRVLNLAASEWMDRQGKTWLETAERIEPGNPQQNGRHERMHLHRAA